MGLATRAFLIASELRPDCPSTHVTCLKKDHGAAVDTRRAHGRGRVGTSTVRRFESTAAFHCWIVPGSYLMGIREREVDGGAHAAALTKADRINERLQSEKGTQKDTVKLLVPSPHVNLLVKRPT